MITVQLRHIVSLYPGMPSPAREAITKLSLLPLHPKTKYRISRIADKVDSENKAFEKARFAAIKDMGEPVEYVPEQSIADGEGIIHTVEAARWEVITDPLRLEGPNVQYRVRAENEDAFNKSMEELLGHQVKFQFDAIPVEDLKKGNGEPVDIEFDLSPILWMLTDGDEGE